MTVLTMHEVAEALGYSYDGFRKIWPDWVRTLAFPRPFAGQGRRGSPVKWDAADVLAWKEARKAALSPREAAPTPPRVALPAAPLTSGDDGAAEPPPCLVRQAARHRAALSQLMNGA
jgi:predicted DNA-binding transcriptional regulator AlpA